MKKSGYKIQTFPASRLFTIDTCRIGLRKHHIKAVIEVDVTDSRKKMKKRRAELNERISFTSWILKCIAAGVSEYREVHALRKGRNKLVVFDDVDMSVIVEKTVDGKPVPLPLVIRAVDKKTSAEILDEIEQAKSAGVNGAEDYVMDNSRKKDPIKMFLMLPQFIRRPIWKAMLSNPHRVKEMMGTVSVTSVGMMGRVNGWFIPYSIHPLCFALGSIIKKPGVVKNSIEAREFLEMTILIDHDVIDGAPAARFVSRLKNLIENGYEL